MQASRNETGKKEASDEEERVGHFARISWLRSLMGHGWAMRPATFKAVMMIAFHIRVGFVRRLLGVPALSLIIEPVGLIIRIPLRILSTWLHGLCHVRIKSTRRKPGML